MGIRTLPGRTQSFKFNGGGIAEPQFGFDASLSSQWVSALCPGELKVSRSVVVGALEPRFGLDASLSCEWASALCPGELKTFNTNGAGSIEPQFGFDTSLSSEWASALCPGELKVSIPMVPEALNPNLVLTHHSQANGHPLFARANLKFQVQWWRQHLRPIWV